MLRSENVDNSSPQLLSESVDFHPLVSGTLSSWTRNKPLAHGTVIPVLFPKACSAAAAHNAITHDLYAL
jgi:hypothetical protein